MFKAKKISLLCLQSFLFRLIIDRYFVITVLSFEFIVAFIKFFLVVFKKLLSHSNHLSFLVNNLVHQPFKVFCSHLMKVNLTKDWSTRLAISKPNSIFFTKVGFVSTGEKYLILLPLGIPCSYLNCLKSLSPLYKVALHNPTRKMWSNPRDLSRGDGHFHQ